MTGATRVRLAAHSLVTIAGETGSWNRVAVLDHDATALHAWYLALAEAIRRTVPVPPPESSDGAPDREVLRYLDEAVADRDDDAIRSAIGAALARDHLGHLRRFESPLALALGKLAS